MGEGNNVYVKTQKKKLTTPTTAIASTSTLAALGKAPTFKGSKLQLVIHNKVGPDMLPLRVGPP